jgi:hypothetical protein
VTTFERLVRARVIQTLRDTSVAPSVADLALVLGVNAAQVRQALLALAKEHRLALHPGTDRVWMAHPFSAVRTDFLVRIGDREWYANCAWDGLSILALLGDGTLETHSPATGDPLTYVVREGHVAGEGIVHSLVPPRSFWDDVGFT